MVCREDFEQRHPSDFLRVQKEKIAVPWSRPYGTDTFLPACTPEGHSAMSGLAMAGCSVAGVGYTPVVNRDTMPSFCTLTTVQPHADVGTADCATIGF